MKAPLKHKYHVLERAGGEKQAPTVLIYCVHTTTIPAGDNNTQDATAALTWHTVLQAVCSLNTAMPSLRNAKARAGPLHFATVRSICATCSKCDQKHREEAELRRGIHTHTHTHTHDVLLVLSGLPADLSDSKTFGL